MCVWAAIACWSVWEFGKVLVGKDLGRRWNWGFIAEHRSYYDVTGGKYDLGKYIEATGGERLSGFQFRYVKLLAPDARLTCPILPYSEIDRVGGRMVKGQRR